MVFTYEVFGALECFWSILLNELKWLPLFDLLCLGITIDALDMVPGSLLFVPEAGLCLSLELWHPFFEFYLIISVVFICVEIALYSFLIWE